MRRILLFSFATIFFTCISGCGSGYGGGGGGQIVPPNALDGQYAFVLSGFDSTGATLSVAGSITADGHGYITGGSIDVNDNAMISVNSTALAGSYTLDSNIRGIITLTNTIGSVTHPLAFAFTLRTDGTSGDVIGLDTNNFILAGTMQRQDSTAFSLSKLAGNFAFEIDANSTGRRVVDGRFTLDQNGMGTNGLSDASWAGTGPTA